MNTQPNSFVTLDWLMPLFNEQLSRLYGMWQQVETEADFLQMAEEYHQLNGALQVANLPILAQLSSGISALARELAAQNLPNSYVHNGSFASELLQSELNHYAATGSFHSQLVVKSTYELAQVLPTFRAQQLDPARMQRNTTQVLEVKRESGVKSDDYKLAQEAAERLSVHILTPRIENAKPLTSMQFIQLSMVWRQQTQKLLVANQNDTVPLEQLRKVSRYLWLSMTDKVMQSLWYLTTLWLENLCHNEHPKPSQFAALLAKLDQVIHILSLAANEVEASLLNSQLVDSKLKETSVEGLLVDVYIQLSGLKETNSQAQSVLTQLYASRDVEQKAFLPRVLNQLEKLIFDLQNPEHLLEPLTQMKRQLAQRGWALYESYIDQVLIDLHEAMQSDDMFAQMQWQIERQLQELYGAIMTTHETIKAKIGDATTFSRTANGKQDDDTMVSTLDGLDNHDAIRQLRIAVENIKTNFNSYLQRHQWQLLSDKNEFTDITQSFGQIGFYDVSEVTDDLAELFERIKEHQLMHISWKLTNAIAESLASLELFLDYLAQQVFDRSMLKQAHEHIMESNRLLDRQLENPDEVTLDSPTAQGSATIDTDVVRYDDSGEVIINPEDVKSNSVENFIEESEYSQDALINDDLEVVSGDITDVVGANPIVLDDYDDQVSIGDIEEVPFTNIADSNAPVTMAIDTSVEEIDDESAESVEVEQQELLEDSDALKAARAALKDDDFSMDEEIREIFIEEADEVLEQLDEHLPAWQQNPQDLSPLTEIRRGFHTLKGSGRMVGAFNAGEMAWAVENMLNRVLDKTLPVSKELVGFITETKALIPTLVADFANQQPPSIDPAVTVLKANNLLAGKPINQGLSTAQNQAAQDTLIQDADMSQEVAAPVEVDDTEVLEEQTLSFTDDDLVGDDDSSSPVVADDDTVMNATSIEQMLPEVLQSYFADAQLPEDDKDADPDIKEIFIEEAGEVLESITPIFAKWKSKPKDETLLTDVRRGFHTLKGSGRMVGANHSGELAWAVENMLNRVLDHNIEPTADIVQLTTDVLAAYPDLVATFEESSSDYPKEMQLWVACANAYSKGLGGEFSYTQLRESINNQFDTHIGAQTQEQSVVTEVESAADTTGADALRTLHSINEKMAEAPVLTQPQSKEEQQFFDIFIDEAKERLAIIKAFVAANEHESHIEVSDDIVRAFHTLRGASGAHSLAAISDVSSAIEHSLELLQQHDADMTPHHLQALAQSAELIETYLSAYDKNTDDVLPDDEQNQQDIQSLQALLDESVEVETATDNSLTVAQLIGDDIDELLDAEWELESRLSEHDLDLVQGYAQVIAEQIQRLMARAANSRKFQIILSSLLAVYEQLIALPELGDDDDVIDALLAGHGELTGLFDALAASMSLKLNQQIIDELNSIAAPAKLFLPDDDDGITSIKPVITPVAHVAETQAAPVVTDVSSQLEEVDTSLVAEPVITDDDMGSENTETQFEQQTQTLESESQPVITEEPTEPVEQERTKATIPFIDFEPIETDAELLEIFLEEAQELDVAIGDAFAKWRAAPNDMEALKELQRHLHTIKGGARMAGIRSIGDLTHEAETIYENFVTGKLKPSVGWVSVMQGLQDTLSAQIDYVVNYQQSFYANTLVDELQQLANEGEVPDDVSISLPILPEETVVEENVQVLQPVKKMGGDATTASARYDSLVIESWEEKIPDPDILAVFLEEAEELVTSSSRHLQAFRSNSSDIASLQALQRELHTIKGGARMVSANGIADLAHQMESVYEDLASRRRPATRMVSQLLAACHDWLDDAVYLLKHDINPTMPRQLINTLAQFSLHPDSLQQVRIDSLQPQLDIIADYEEQQKQLSSSHDISDMPPMTGGFGATQTGSMISNEMIRISAALMERMINLSGESAINRARIDMGMSSLTNSIEEMGITVQRLADQLRRMDIELEAQILSQIDDDEMLNNADFDPLEMDQYSALNQLSKSLSESASDLLDIKSTLLEKTRDSESLLLQLSRTQAELQDGLMNSRMVPFSRLVPRLQRIVRQTANELNKSVELHIINADDEMDRTILERITSPLEHMLRNAVDHGVEGPEERIQAGKSRTGQVTLEVVREGSEVVINLTDDGSGIDVEAVRRKVINQGLIDPDDDSLTDVDIMQYIFNAGLTTTKKVTQISGRGVGMDVVRSEIRQLGGVVSVSSEAGRGSRFTLRVPLTVAVSDALVVRAADRYYAIPLVQIERVVRINPEELFAYYKSDKNTLDIEGTNYRVRYLNEILSGNPLNQLVVSTNTSLPVIIVKSQTSQNLALQVDEISGSRIEVVVKPLGRQLSHIAGISAATIMGDGSVMLILDPIALMRNAPVLTTVSTTADTSQPTIEQDKRPTILVVDDSVTVRKVTSRFLERQGLEAIVARDGVDAIEILQELTPDLILLDIEMPRMDGFEVATQVRHDSRLKQIPIIMITSRTGEKHRERAFEIGVNDYMGKPFQENELLKRIQGLLGEHVGIQDDG